MQYRLKLAVILSVLVTAVIPQTGAAAHADAPRAACKAKPTQVHAFHVEAEWTKEVYSRLVDKFAPVTVTVTRPAHEDPADLGIPIDPPLNVPVEGVTVWTTVITGRYPYPYGYGQTDSLGQVHFKIPLKTLKPGKWDVSHYADKWTNQGGCPDVEEWGYLYESPGFTLIP